MREIFRAGSTSQFVLHGNVADLVPTPDGESGAAYVSPRKFLTDVMFSNFDVVIVYDRGRGVRLPRGSEFFHQFLKVFDTFHGTSWATMPDVRGDASKALDLSGLLPRDPKRAIELIDRFIRANIKRTITDPDGARRYELIKIAVIIDYAHFVIPQGDPLYISGDLSQMLIQILDWGSDPSIAESYVATVLITEALADLNRLVVESPYSSKVKIDLPNAPELIDFIGDLTRDIEDFSAVCEVDRTTLAEKLVGLSRVNVRNLVLRAVRNKEVITHSYLTRVKKELIEKEAFGRLEFVETTRTMDDVAGHVEAKAWLRQDIALLRNGLLRAIPMGYLLTGRIGTGKTYLAECYSGEVGIPCVELKNFRDKWVGATEGNLERIFNILRAIGQVVVFVDEADQAMGRRGGGEGDSGLSGRIYAMMAKEMSDTRNRGKIIWMFATSRPDLLEVDLKRQGRLDVHIPLFPPSEPQDRRDLFAAMARKLALGIDPAELPALPDDTQIGGNEMEGIIVRALRLHVTQPEGQPQRSLPEIIKEVIGDFRPSAHTERLEYMDLLAVKECTDVKFLPPRFRVLNIAQVNRRLSELRHILGERD